MPKATKKTPTKSSSTKSSSKKPAAKKPAAKKPAAKKTPAKPAAKKPAVKKLKPGTVGWMIEQLKGLPLHMDVLFEDDNDYYVYGVEKMKLTCVYEGRALDDDQIDEFEEYRRVVVDREKSVVFCSV